jgi:hypothetical protein
MFALLQLEQLQQLLLTVLMMTDPTAVYTIFVQHH